MSYKRVKNCCVIGCVDQTSIRHHFPKDLELRKIWIKNINNPKLIKEFRENVANFNYKVCHRHFSDKYKTLGFKRGLPPNAIPTLYLTGDDSEESTTVIETEPPNSFKEKRKDPLECLNIFKTKSLTTKKVPETVAEELEVTKEKSDLNQTETLETPTQSQADKNGTTVTDLPLFKKIEVSYKLVKVQSNSNNLETSFKLIPVTTKTTLNYDSTNTCRLCLVKTTELVSLFDKKRIGGKDLLYKEMVVECASVQIEENDKLPKGICSECIEKLNSSYKFRKLCEKSQQNLNKFLNKFEDTSKEKSLIVEETRDNLNDIEDDSEIVVESKSNSQTSENKENSQNQQSMVDQQEPIKYVCKICNLNFSSFRFLSGHLKNTHKGLNSSYSCRICSQTFPCVRSLNKHKETHINGGTFNCSICTKSFKRYNLLIEHLRVHGERKFICQFCNKAFIRKRGLEDHLKRRHTERKLYICEVCGKNVVGHGRLKAHMLFHNRNKKYICEMCGKLYHSAQYLKVHERIHKGEKPFSCTECGKTFTNRTGLRSHMKSHSDEKPYLCSQCGIGFKTGPLLNKHSVVHLTEKPHVCHVCLKKFLRSSSLKMHLKTHGSKYDHFCNFCNKGFHRLSNLKLHVMQIHTGERPFSCHICGRGFVRDDYFRNHLKTH